MRGKRAILPSAEIARAISEVIVERDIPEVDYHTMCSIVVDAASVIEPNNFYEPFDSVDNHLMGLDREFDSVTMKKCALSEVEGLAHELYELSRKLHDCMIRIGLGELNTSPDRILPILYVVDITQGGDIIVEVTN